MMDITTEISDIDREAWCGLIQSSHYASAFQSPQFYAFLKASDFFEPFVFSVSDNDGLKGVVVGYVQRDGSAIKRFFSRRAIIHAGPLLAPGITMPQLAALLNEVKCRLKNEAIYIEFRNYFDYSEYQEAFASTGFEYKPHLNFHIDTADSDILWRRITYNPKRYIKVAARLGAAVVTNPSADQIGQYYAILQRLYSKRIKTPIPPRSVFEQMAYSDCCKLILIEYQSEIVGGVAAVGIANTPLYEWYVAGDDVRSKSVHPSIMATYAAIRYSNEHSHPYFDMMGAGVPGSDYGVRAFKAKFGGELVSHGRYILPLNRALFRFGSWGINLLKTLSSGERL